MKVLDIEFDDGIFDLDKIISVIKEKNSTGILDNFFGEIEENIEEHSSSGHMVAIGTK